LRILYVTFFLVIIDQLSKIFIKGFTIPLIGYTYKGLEYGQSIDIINNFFQLTFIENQGMAFGLEIGGKLFLTFFTIFATILIIYFIYKNRTGSLYLRISMAFILGGAIGNLIDRMFYGVLYGSNPLFFGKVVDFFHLKIPDFTLFGKNFHSWPIFYFADIWVTVGFILILFGHKRIFKKEVSLEGDSESNLNATLKENDIPEKRSETLLTGISTESSGKKNV
jgi:signal peptidase II